MTVDGADLSGGDNASRDGAQKNIALTHTHQQSAYQDAREVVANDVDTGVIDADEWGGRPTDGEVVRILAMAYLGELDYGEE